MNKKALSDLVAIVSIISVSILAISILSYYIINSSNSLLLSPEKSCLDLKLSDTLKIESVCYNLDKSETQTIIKRSLKSPEIEDIDFIISSDTNTEHWKAGRGCENCKLPKEGESKIYSLDSVDSREKTLYLLIDNCEMDKKVISVC